MIVKPYKLNKSFVELLYDFSDEKNYDILKSNITVGDGLI